MPKCQTCGKWGLFLKLTSGLCPECVLKAQSHKEETKQPKQVKVASGSVKTYKVAGVQYYTDALMCLAVSNANYNLKKQALLAAGITSQYIWKNEFKPNHIEVIPEPDNPYDPKAIKVVVDGHHVGHIKAGSCAHLLKVIQENRIQKIEAKITGGPYKILDDYDGDGIYTLEQGDAPYRVTLYITEG